MGTGAATLTGAPGALFKPPDTRGSLKQNQSIAISVHYPQKILHLVRTMGLQFYTYSLMMTWWVLEYKSVPHR